MPLTLPLVCHCCPPLNPTFISCLSVVHYYSSLLSLPALSHSRTIFSSHLHRSPSIVFPFLIPLNAVYCFFFAIYYITNVHHSIDSSGSKTHGRTQKVQCSSTRLRLRSISIATKQLPSHCISSMHSLRDTLHSHHHQEHN